MSGETRIVSTSISNCWIQILFVCKLHNNLFSLLWVELWPICGIDNEMSAWAPKYVHRCTHEHHWLWIIRPYPVTVSTPGYGTMDTTVLSWAPLFIACCSRTPAFRHEMSGRHSLTIVLIQFWHLTLPLFSPSFCLLQRWRTVRPLIEVITLALIHKLTVCCYDITKCHTQHAFSPYPIRCQWTQGDFGWCFLKTWWGTWPNDRRGTIMSANWC